MLGVFFDCGFGFFPKKNVYFSVGFNPSFKENWRIK